MLVLLTFSPFELQIRFSTNHYPLVSLTHFVFYSWFWVYSLVGYGTIGFITRPLYQIAQPGSLQTVLPFLFVGALVGYKLGLVSRKTAIQLGYVSLFPGLLVLGVNLILSIFTPGSPSINAPVPLPFASILGILVLRRSTFEKESDSWLSEPE